MAYPAMGIMPGEHDWMERVFGRGPLAPPPSTGGLLGRIQQATEPFGGMGNLGLALLANSGYSTTPRSFGEILGTSALQARQIRDQSLSDRLREEYMRAQIEKMRAPPPRDVPTSVQEYEYARQNGFQGSFQDWMAQGGRSERPYSIQEWEFYSKLPPEVRRQYLEMKRNPNIVVRDVNQVPTVIAPSVSGTTTTPLSTLNSEIDAASRKTEATAEAAERGKTRGEITGGIEKKGATARAVQDTLDLAEPLIDIATGSVTGAAADKVAGFFGVALDGAAATAQLKILQANLMANMPRMEGPQSDRDVQLYREAAGELGDPTVPRAQKKAALKIIREIHQKYADRAESQRGASDSQINDLLNKYAPQ